MAKCTECGAKTSFMMSMCDSCMQAGAKRQEEEDRASVGSQSPGHFANIRAMDKHDIAIRGSWVGAVVFGIANFFLGGSVPGGFQGAIGGGLLGYGLTRLILAFFPTDMKTAAREGKLMALQKRLRAADIGATDESGWTLLHHAVEAGRVETVKFLLAKGADVSARSNGNSTPLSIARRKENQELIKLLEAAGAQE